MQKRRMQLNRKGKRALFARLACLLLLCAVFITGVIFAVPSNEKNSEGYTSGGTPASIGSLTYSDYATRTDGLVFDSIVLNKLYDRILGTSGTGRYDAVYKKVDASQSDIQTGKSADVLTYPHSMDYSALSGGAATGTNKTAPNPIILEFGGMKWTAVYLSTNTTKSSDGTNPDLILTLMATENTSATWVYGGHKRGYTSGGYAGNIYSTSYVRVAAMNAGGDSPINYATNNGTTWPGTNADATYLTGTVTQASRIAHPYAQFTLSENVIQKKSLTKYLVQPKYMLLQKAESTANVYTANCSNPQSEAWGRGGTDGIDRPYDALWHAWLTSDGRFPNYDESLYPHYYDWENDFVWLPSTAEKGFYFTANNAAYSYWGIPFNDPCLAITGDAWTRSGSDQTAHEAIRWDGTFASDVMVSRGVIPALHLNLTKATESLLDIPEQPSSTTYTYSGVEQTLDMTNMSYFDANKMYVTGIVRKADNATGTVAPSVDTTETDATKRTKVKVTDAGTYTVTVKAKTGTIDGVANSQYTWSHRSAASDLTVATFEITVKKKQLTVPTLAPPANEKNYSGETLEFEIPNYPNDKVAPTPATNPTEKYPKDPLSASVTRKLNGVAQSSNGLPSGSPEKKVNASNVGYLLVSIVDAGDYEVKISISDKVNYEWVSTGTTSDQADKTVSLKVNAKDLTLSYKTTYKDDNNTANATVLSWSADKDFTAEFTIDGVYNGNSSLTPPTTRDDVEISIKLTRENDSSFTPIEVKADYDTTSTGAYGKYKVTIDKNKFSGGKYAIGTYAITFGLTNTASHKKNESYSLSTALQSWTNKLIISASSAGLDKYTFKYTVGSGSTPQDFKQDENGNPIYKVPYVYDTDNGTGMVYRIVVDTTDFADANIAVDTSKTEPAHTGWSNGYLKGEASKAGVYNAKVALKTTDPNAKFTLPNGSQSSTIEIDIIWEIEKQTVDLNGITWQYLQDGESVVYAKYQKIDPNDDSKGSAWHYAVKENGATVYKALNNGTTITNGLSAVPGLPWKGTNYTLTLGNLPGGVSVKTTGQPYSGNQDKFITGATNKTASVTANGLSYDTTNYNTITIPALEWRIVKAQITLNDGAWDAAEKGEDGKVFYLPQLTSSYSGTGIEYKYFEVSGSTETEIAIDDIKVDAGTVRKYYILPVLSGNTSIDGTSKWNEVLEFVDDSGNVIDTTTSTGAAAAKKGFETGDTRTVVSVSGQHTVTYDGKPHGLRVETLTDGTQVGEIEIKVQSNDFTDVELNYYLRNTDGTKGTQLSDPPVNAGEYIIEPVLTGGTESDYVLSKKQIVFKIEPFTFDLSGVKWGYIDEVPVLDEDGKPVIGEDGKPVMEEVEVAYDPVQGLPYRVQTDANGAPVLDTNGKPLPKAYTPVLIGLPKGDANGDDDAKALYELFTSSGFVSKDAGTGLGDYLTYTGDTSKGEVTPAGTKNKVKYVFGTDDQLGKNFRVTSLPTNLAAELEWIITPRKIAIHKNEELTYSGQTLELLKTAGLDEKEVGVYYTLKGLAFYPASGADPAIYNANLLNEITGMKHAGTYRFSVDLTDKDNFKWDDSGLLKTSVQNIEIVVHKLVIEVTEWSGDGSEPYEPLFAGEVPAVWEHLIKKGDEEVGDAWSDYSLTQFTQTLREKKANPNDPDNIEFKYPDGEEIKTFTTVETAPMIPVKQPTATKDESTYTGKEIDFTPDGLEAIQNNVRIILVDEDGTEHEGTIADFKQTNAGKYTIIVRLKTGYKWLVENNTNDLVVEFEIKKAQVEPVWTTDENGNPKATLPSFEGLGEIFEYHYYDENGEEVPEKSLKGDRQYRISIKLKEDAANNIELLENGVAAEGGEVFSEELYTHPNKGLGFLTNKLMGLPLWLWILIAVLVLLLLIILIVLIAKRRKKKAAEKAANAEKEEEKARREEERLEREEEKRRREEEREEERRIREEEREEEKRRREEEREEEKRRREEEREEREEERRRREEDRRKDEPSYGGGYPPPYPPYAAPVMPAAMPMTPMMPAAPAMPSMPSAPASNGLGSLGIDGLPLGLDDLSSGASLGNIGADPVGMNGSGERLGMVGDRTVASDPSTALGTLGGDLPKQERSPLMQTMPQKKRAGLGAIPAEDYDVADVEGGAIEDEAAFAADRQFAQPAPQPQPQPAPAPVQQQPAPQPAPAPVQQQPQIIVQQPAPQPAPAPVQQQPQIIVQQPAPQSAPMPQQQQPQIIVQRSAPQPAPAPVQQQPQVIVIDGNGAHLETGMPQQQAPQRQQQPYVVRQPAPQPAPMPQQQQPQILVIDENGAHMETRMPQQPAPMQQPYAVPQPQPQPQQPAQQSGNKPRVLVIDENGAHFE